MNSSIDHDPVAPRGSDSTAVVGPRREVPVPAALTPGSAVADRYEIREVAGRGGFAIVYVAWDRLLRREVALKVLRPDRVDAAALTRFRREAAIARDVESPHLVRIWDIGTADGVVYLSMERIAGQSLRERLREGSLPIAEVERIAQQLIAGLACLHAAKVVHRDIKPSNVLLPAGGTVKLVDLGLARRRDGDETQVTQAAALVGTLEYLSPEQAMGTPLDARSDLYSVGVVMYEMLTGRLPHQGASSLGTVLAHLSATAPEIRRQRPDTPRYLARIVERLLAKRPEQRYPSAEAVRAALRRQRSWLARDAVRAAAAIAATAAAVAAGAWGVTAVATERSDPRDRFAKLVLVTGADEEGEDSGFDAVAADGSVLWRRRGVKAAAARVIGEPGAPERIATLLAPVDGFQPAGQRVLRLLDPRTGETKESLALPDASGFFPGLPDSYNHSFHPLDLDGDGADELLIHFFHRLWPSFTCLYEPRLSRVRLLFVAAGHHRPAGLIDADGDGRSEVLFHGISNRMGHYFAAAAVSPWPPVNAMPLEPPRTAFTPDAVAGATSDANVALLWYALLPPETCLGSRCLEIDGERRRLSLRTLSGGELRLGFDGFRLETASSLAPAERQSARFEVYRKLREAQRQLDSGGAERAATAAVEALRLAEPIGDHVLVDWARRTRVRTMIASGDPRTEGELAALLASTLVPVDAGFEAARELHRARHVEAAVDRYRAALEADPAGGHRIVRSEILRGLLFALGELERWDEAAADLRRFATSVPTGTTEKLAAWLTWRQGGVPEPLRIDPGSDDFTRWLALEIRWRRGEDTEALLGEVGRELSRPHEAEALLVSLEAELLRGVGRLDEALASIELAREPSFAPHNELVSAHDALVVARAVARKAASPTRSSQSTSAPDELRLARRQP